MQKWNKVCMLVHFVEALPPMSTEHQHGKKNTGSARCDCRRADWNSIFVSSSSNVKPMCQLEMHS